MRSRNSRRWGVVIAAFAVGVTAPTIAPADTVGPITFEPPVYFIGPINGQDGWQSTNLLLDHEVDLQIQYPSFGTQSLRISNAVTSNSFGDQTFSKQLLNEAGEPFAAGDGVDAGRQSNFEATWEFASTVPGEEQPGLSVVASPDRGDGARMSWVQMLDTPSGLEVNFYDYQDAAPFGTSLGDSNGCSDEDDFVFTPVASGLDRTMPHTIKITMKFVNGPRNDIVKVFVDGSLVHTGTSWEDYFRYCEGNATRAVDSILFRTSDPPVPATLGEGFFIDNMTLSSGCPPKNACECKNGGWELFTIPRTFTSESDCIQFVKTGQ